MKRILTAVILVPLVVVAIFMAPLWGLSLIVGACAVIAGWEFLTLCEGYGVRPFKWYTLIVLALFFFPFEKFAPQNARMINFGYSALLVLSALVLLTMAMAKENLRDGLPAAALSFMTLPYVGIGFAALLIPIKSLPFGSLLITYLLIVVWSGDIFAYYVGKNFGRHKMAPRISPGKSWEGAAASLIGATAIGTLFLVKAPAVWAFLTRIHLAEAPSVLGGTIPVHSPVAWKIALISIAINAAAQVGDLVESMIKRGANAKDSGAILPGHGGMLDRVDALLFAAPVGVLLFIITNLNLAR